MIPDKEDKETAAHGHAVTVSNYRCFAGDDCTDDAECGIDAAAKRLDDDVNRLSLVILEDFFLLIVVGVPFYNLFDNVGRCFLVNSRDG